MNNSDHNDFRNWQNGDDSDMNNPNNWFKPDGSGFFYYGPMNENFKKMWENMYDESSLEHMKNYLNMDDIMENFKNSIDKKYPKSNKNRNKTTVTFTQDEYLKLIEIRGYLAITEQFAHVKALDKVLNQITMLPQGPKGSK